MPIGLRTITLFGNKYTEGWVLHYLHSQLYRTFVNEEPLTPLYVVRDTSGRCWCFLELGCQDVQVWYLFVFSSLPI